MHVGAVLKVQPVEVALHPRQQLDGVDRLGIAGELKIVGDRLPDRLARPLPSAAAAARRYSSPRSRRSAVPPRTRRQAGTAPSQAASNGWGGRSQCSSSQPLQVVWAKGISGFAHQSGAGRILSRRLVAARLRLTGRQQRRPSRCVGHRRPASPATRSRAFAQLASRRPAPGRCESGQAECRPRLTASDVLRCNRFCSAVRTVVKSVIPSRYCSTASSCERDAAAGAQRQQLGPLLRLARRPPGRPRLPAARSARCSGSWQRAPGSAHPGRGHCW